MKLQATYFVSGFSNAEVVELIIENGILSFEVGTKRVAFHKNDLQFELPMPNCPFVISLPDGARLEISPENYDLKKVVKIFGKINQLILWLENNTKGIVAAGVGLVILVVFIGRVVIPHYSLVLAKMVPQATANALDQPLLAQWNRVNLHPSELSVQKQSELREYFLRGSGEDLNIEFRRFRGGTPKSCG